MSRTRLLLALVTTLSALFAISTGQAHAAAGSYTFDGGTPAEQSQVVSALGASSFDFSLIPTAVTVHVGAYPASFATPGNVFLGATLLDSGTFSWGVVLHEFGHQVDFALLDDAKRATLQKALGGKAWCYTTPLFNHSDYGCERFASELSWAFWQSSDNCMAPSSPSDEGGHMPAAAFRALLLQLIGSQPAAAPAQASAGSVHFAPTVFGHSAKPKAKPRAKPKAGRHG